MLVRILVVIYIGQKCFVRWNGANSETFNVMNGVRQGAVISPFLHLYRRVDPEAEKLRNGMLGWDKISGGFSLCR